MPYNNAYGCANPILCRNPKQSARFRFQILPVVPVTPFLHSVTIHYLLLMYWLIDSFSPDILLLSVYCSIVYCSINCSYCCLDCFIFCSYVVTAVCVFSSIVSPIRLFFCFFLQPFAYSATSNNRCSTDSR